jgi:hypothetical protein
VARGAGVVGYATHLVGAAAELFGLHISLVLVPGAIFELALAAWLLTNGFTTTVYHAPRALPATPTAARQR